LALPLNNPLSAGNITSILNETVAVGSESPDDLANEADPTLANAIPCGSPSDGDPGRGAGPGPVTPGLPGGPVAVVPVNGVPAPVSPVAPPVPVDVASDPCLAPAVQEYTLVGRCTTLDAEGGDHTPTCNPTVTLVRIPAGGLAVCFAAADGTRVVFIGTKPTTVDPRSSSSLQALDRVRFTIPGDAGEKAASGTCSLGNLNKGVPATIVCRANTDAGAFDGTFVTDGGAPRLASR
jgi:hypothetical protein